MERMFTLQNWLFRLYQVERLYSWRKSLSHFTPVQPVYIKNLSARNLIALFTILTIFFSGNENTDALPSRDCHIDNYLMRLTANMLCIMRLTASSVRNKTATEGKGEEKQRSEKEYKTTCIDEPRAEYDAHTRRLMFFFASPLSSLLRWLLCEVYCVKHTQCACIVCVFVFVVVFTSLTTVFLRLLSVTHRTCCKPHYA